MRSAHPGFDRGRVLSSRPPLAVGCRSALDRRVPRSGEHHAPACSFVCRSTGNGVFRLRAGPDAARRLSPLPGCRPPSPPASRLSRPRTMGPSAPVRASRSLESRRRVKRSRTGSIPPRSRIGPATGGRSSTANAPLSTSTTTASSKSWTRGVPASDPRDAPSGKPTPAKSRPSLIFCQLVGTIDHASALDAPPQEPT